jgi:hypothetical protein
MITSTNSRIPDFLQLFSVLAVMKAIKDDAIKSMQRIYFFTEKYFTSTHLDIIRSTKPREIRRIGVNESLERSLYEDGQPICHYRRCYYYLATSSARRKVSSDQPYALAVSRRSWRLRRRLMTGRNVSLSDGSSSIALS